LSPESSIEVPSAPILKRTSMSGTRLMQTAIFNGHPHVKDFTRNIIAISHQPSAASEIQLADG